MLGMARLGRAASVPAHVHALAAGAAGRRVPAHLTMTLDELLAAKDTRATHRMIERAVHAPAEQTRTANVPVRAVHALAAGAAGRRVPAHLTMTLDEVLAAEDKHATHRLVHGGVKALVEL